MKSIKLDFKGNNPKGSVDLPSSKSLSNRALILQSLFPEMELLNVSSADDSVVLRQALQKTKGRVDVGAAGTAMRFALAWFASQPQSEVVLTGSSRMLKRPIGPLVEALQNLGADIKFQGENGFPPLRVKGKRLEGGALQIDGSLSSQFASALLLVAPKFERGLQLSFSGESVSKSYLKMTVALMQKVGVSAEFIQDEIHVPYTEKLKPQQVVIESDWSSAAFWYGFVALSDDAKIQLNGLGENSMQGDARLVQIFRELGVKSTFNEAGVLLENTAAQKMGKLFINLSDNPDLAQPLAVVCAALGIAVEMTGLQTLKIKETDRLLALKLELAKVGIDAKTTENSLSFEETEIHLPTEPFKTYEDHRMAMSFAILASRFPVEIENPEVVSKSYPDFFADVKRIMS